MEIYFMTYSRCFICLLMLMFLHHRNIKIPFTNCFQQKLWTVSKHIWLQCYMAENSISPGIQHSIKLHTILHMENNLVTATILSLLRNSKISLFSTAVFSKWFQFPITRMELISPLLCSQLLHTFKVNTSNVPIFHL